VVQDFSVSNWRGFKLATTCIVRGSNTTNSASLWLDSSWMHLLRIQVLQSLPPTRPRKFSLFFLENLVSKQGDPTPLRKHIGPVSLPRECLKQERHSRKQVNN
jgi:hypothetical protein